MSEQDVGVPTFMQVVKSVLAAFLGVQTNRNRERDFSKGKPWHYIVIALFFVVVFILILVGVVQLVLHFAG